MQPISHTRTSFSGLSARETTAGFPNSPSFLPAHKSRLACGVSEISGTLCFTSGSRLPCYACWRSCSSYGASSIAHEPALHHNSPSPSGKKFSYGRKDPVCMLHNNPNCKDRTSVRLCSKRGSPDNWRNAENNLLRMLPEFTSNFPCVSFRVLGSWAERRITPQKPFDRAC